LAALTASTAAAQVSNSVGLAWNSGSPQFRLWIGTNSGSYQRSFTYTTTNAWLAPGQLFYGTNFAAVTAFITDGTNATISDYSGEIRIVRIAPPAPLEIVITNPLLCSTNLAAWTVISNEFRLAITPEKPAGFYRANPGAQIAIKRIADTVAIQP
jgi:hypothetical protein